MPRRALRRALLPILVAILSLSSASCDPCAARSCGGTRPPECRAVSGCIDARTLAVCGSKVTIRIDECCTCEACTWTPEPCPSGQACQEFPGLLFGMTYGECIDEDPGRDPSADAVDRDAGVRDVAVSDAASGD